MATKTKPNPYARFDEACPIFGVRLMHDLDVRDFHAAAILGNGGHESAGFTVMQEIRPRAGKGGYGVFQWTGPRRDAFMAFCKAHSLSPDGDAANYGFVLKELKGSEAHTLTNLKHTTTLKAATETFCLLFERPGVLALPSRLKWAERALPLIRHAVAGAETPAGQPEPVLPAKLPEPKIVAPEAVPVEGDSAWARGTANMRKVFGPAPRRAA